MTRAILCAVLASLTIGCAAKKAGYYTEPKEQAVENLTVGLAAANLATVDGACLAIVTLKSGKQVRARLEDVVCSEAAVIVATEQRRAAQQQAAQQQAAPPKAPEPAK